MKQKFSTHWKGSSQPRKKHKYLANAPLHIKHKFLSATLSKPLRKQHGRRSIEVRKGDEVKIMRGNFAGKTGKVATVQTIKTRVAIDGIQRQKKDGTKINVWFDASKLMITTLNMEDKKRMKKRNVALEETKKTEVKESQSTKMGTKKNAPNKK